MAAKSIARIKPVFAIFHLEKKDVNVADQLWGTQNLTNSRQPLQYLLKHLLFVVAEHLTNLAINRGGKDI